MPTLVLDQVAGSELEVSQDGAAYVRTGWVNDIDLDDENDPDALVKVMAVSGIPPFGSSLGPQSANLLLRRVRIRPDLAKFRRVQLFLHYDNLGPNLTPTAYMLRDRTFSVQKQTCFVPGTRIPILVGYTASGAETEDDITSGAVFFNVNSSARSLQLTTLMYGRPTAGFQDYVNYVNNASWPTGDATLNFQFPVVHTSQVKSATAKPPGYWRLSAYASEYNRQSGMTLVQAEAITQVTEDWSEVGLLRNEQTGNFPFGGISQADRVALHSDMATPAYSYGIIYPIATPHRGIIRWGPYPMTSFSGLFGF